MKQSPIGIQDFSEIINNGYLYVDKTSLIYNLVKPPKGYYFLSRPRRFGKSLLISTLEEIFSGHKELFKGLWIEQSDYEWREHPVIRIDFSKLSSIDSKSLQQDLQGRLHSVGKSYGVNLVQGDTIPANINRLIEELQKKFQSKVVILIDEYDSPIISNITNQNLCKANREVLASFYRTIKGCDEYLRFVFLTGVSKFAKVSVFSGLNNLIDISLDAEYASLLGYTQEELESYFSEAIEVVSKIQKKDRSTLLEEIRQWYNGYRFSNVEATVYNPFSVLLFFFKKRFDNYWFETGTPTFLLDLIKTRQYDITKLDGMKLADDDFASYEIETMPIVPLLYSTGYITISNVIAQPDNTSQYEMCYPNFEVQNSFLRSVIRLFIGYDEPVSEYLNDLKQALDSQDMKQFVSVLQTIFAAIPYELEATVKRSSKGKGYESHYQTVIYAILKVTGMQVSAEERTNRGRIDLVAESAKSIYIFEMKVDKPAKEAIEQIKQKGYGEKYRLANKKIFLVGLSFSSTERNITEYEVEEG